MGRIMYSERAEVYRAAFDSYKSENQLIVAVEELSELQKELCKVLRGEGNSEALAEEMADVTIMLEQLRIIFKAEEVVDLHMDMKIRRTAEKLGVPVV
ncbi:MAG: hypothetical protein IJV74_00260 [Clostridia bacterium]|nr:hypothetical protein [Clostridia bacterium]